MTWREMLVCRILLLIARMVNNDIELEGHLKQLATHIEVHGKRADA